jgi:hypothetical protein
MSLDYLIWIDTLLLAFIAYRIQQLYMDKVREEREESEK